jgi:predicted transcriptional regulator
MDTSENLKQDRAAFEDREAAADKWARGYFQLRGVFVQKPENVSNRASTLASLVTARQHRALVLYLMLISVWPWLHDDKVPLEAHVWMNLVHSRSPKPASTRRSLLWSESTLSRTWKYLVKVGLVEKKRGAKGRLKVAPRMEDASAPYEFPTGAKGVGREMYFVVPDRFWIEEDFARLALPGLAVLLVILKETNKAPEFRVTHEQIADWYGLSRSTVDKGLAELRAIGVLEERVEWIPARLSKIRTTTATYLSLSGDYSTKSRSAARAKAERSRRRKEAKAVTGSGPKFRESKGGKRASPK